MNTSHSSRWLVVLTLTTTAASVPALADEIIVPTERPLSVALALAQSGDVITILPGTYQQVPGYSFANKQLTIRGSTGNPADVVLDGANLTTVLTISQAGAGGSIIQDLTIANGRGGAGTNAAGAGVHLSAQASVQFRNCIFRDNMIPGADGDGAAIYSNSCSLRIENCEFENNTLASAIGDGGALLLVGGAHTIADTIFRNNGVATGTAFASGSIGGAVYAENGTLQLVRSTFQGNRSYQGGAAYAAGNTIVTIDQCVFADNQANNGAGFYISSTTGGAPPRVRNSLFVGNTAVFDTAIYTAKGGIFINLSIVGNTASSGYMIGGTTASSIDNCIVWDNTYPAGQALFPLDSPDVVRRCILQQAYTGAAGSGNNRVVDPLFVDASMRNFRLTSLSPAIDAGDSTLYAGPFSDLDGNPRGVDVPDIADAGYALSGPVIDIGAYEFQVEPPPPPCPPDYNRDGVINSQDLFDFLTGFFTGCP